MKSQGNITSRRSIAAATGLALAWLVAPMPAVAQNAYITNQGISPKREKAIPLWRAAHAKLSKGLSVELARRLASEAETPIQELANGGNRMTP